MLPHTQTEQSVIGPTQRFYHQGLRQMLPIVQVVWLWGLIVLYGTFRQRPLVDPSAEPVSRTVYVRSYIKLRHFTALRMLRTGFSRVRD